MNASSRILQMPDGSRITAVSLCASQQEHDQCELVVAVSEFGDFFAFRSAVWYAGTRTEDMPPLAVVAPQITPYDHTPRLPRPRQIYRHFKQQRQYRVQLLSTMALTGIRLVHYRAADEAADRPLWARPLTEFLELVNSVGDGMVQRFTSADAADAASA